MVCRKTIRRRLLLAPVGLAVGVLVADYSSDVCRAVWPAEERSLNPGVERAAAGRAGPAIAKQTVFLMHKICTETMQTMHVMHRMHNPARFPSR